MAAARNWLTPYNFVQNNPVMLWDPTGRVDTEPPRIGPKTEVETKAISSEPLLGPVLEKSQVLGLKIGHDLWYDGQLSDVNVVADNFDNNVEQSSTALVIMISLSNPVNTALIGEIFLQE